MTQAVPDENWPVYSIRRTFYETDDLTKARQKCKKAESESELASTDIEGETEKWTRKRKVRPLQIDSDDQEETDDECQIKYPIPPKIILPPVHTPTSSPRLLQDFNVHSPISSHNPTPTNEETTPSTLRSKLQKPVFEKINSSLDAIAQYLGHIKSEIEELKQTQNDILLRISSPSSTKVASAATLPKEVDMPLMSLDDLRNIENWLEEEEHKEQLINILSYIGGKGTGIITRRVLERVFTNSLAIQCNWTGKNNKFSLKNLHLIPVIIAAVRKNKVAETATESEITGVITSWFRFAKDRNGGRENRRTRSSL